MSGYGGAQGLVLLMVTVSTKHWPAQWRWLGAPRVQPAEINEVQDQCPLDPAVSITKGRQKLYWGDDC